MNLIKYISKTGFNQRFSELYKNPVILVIIISVTVFTCLNFSPDKKECPAVLTYEEIKSALVFEFCLTDENNVTISTYDKVGTINAENIVLTIDTQQLTINLNEPIEIGVEHSQTIYARLVYSDGCYKSNSGEVAYYIDRNKLVSCSGNDEEYNPMADTLQIKNSSEDFPIVENQNKPDKKIVNKTNKSSESLINKTNISYKKEQSKSSNHTTNNTKIQSVQNVRSTTIEASNPPSTKVTVTKKKSQNTVDRSKTVKASYTNTQPPIVTNKTPLVNNVKPTNNKAETNTSAENNSGNFTASRIPIESSGKTGTISRSKSNAKSFNSGTLFTTSYTGISKDCPRSTNYVASDTDLFAISLKSRSNIKLYDLHCHANSNSKVSITLTSFGNTISSFSQHLNMGENQISLSALGELEADISYIIEFKTENKSDLNLYPICANNQHSNKGLKLSYLDNAYAFYGITYDKE